MIRSGYDVCIYVMATKRKQSPTNRQITANVL